MLRFFRCIARLGFLLTFGVSIHGHGFAQAIKQVNVFSERVNEEDTRYCSFSIESVVASAEAALRFNRVTPTNSKGEEIQLYININLMPLPNENRCVFSSRYIFLKHGDAKIIHSNRVVPVEYILCDRARIGVASPRDIQSRANENSRQAVDACISEIERKAK